MDLSRWLQAKRCAVDAADEPLLVELALGLLDDVADDPEHPRPHECAAACELAIATYHALAGDWSIGAALARVKSHDAETRLSKATEVAKARLDAKQAWGRSVGEVLVRVRTVRNLGEQTKARRERSNVVRFPKQRAG